jgi:phosphate starvation-inducible PhoH-like protein
MDAHPVEDVHFSSLSSEDVVRHKLVSRIVDAYAQYDAELTSVARAPGRRDDRKRGPR